MDKQSSLSVGQLATIACILEVSIPKPGNVHRSAEFSDLSFQDFLLSAVAIGPAMNGAVDQRLGETILQSIKATRQVVSTNTNLGLVLLLAPLAMAMPGGVEVLKPDSIRQRLSKTDAEDCRLVYEAIRLAQPGGMGTTEKADLANEPVDNLLTSMSLAADRDLIARQYSNGFCELFEFCVPTLELAVEEMTLADAVIWTHLKTMHEFPDSLIARKTGVETARKSAALAGRVLKSGGPKDAEYFRELSDLDFWLRSDGNRRNPGTTADMIGASLFVCLRRGTIRFPQSD